MHWEERGLQCAAVLLKVRVVWRCELPSPATPSFKSPWHTKERKQAFWPVASNSKHLKANPPTSYMVSVHTAQHLHLKWFLLSVGSTDCCFILPLDFIKVEKDDSVGSKGKSFDPNKWDISPCAHFTITDRTSECDGVYLLVDRMTVTQAQDLSNPGYMTAPYKSSRVIDRGWSYSMPPAGQGSKDLRKSASDEGPRCPTAKPLTPLYVPACVQAL